MIMDAAMVEMSGELAEMLETPEVPEPGLYENVPQERYLSWPIISHSGLGPMERSPAHAKRALDEDDSTADQKFGTEIHCAVFEPDRFEDEYVRGPDGPWNRKPQMDAIKDLNGIYPGAKVIKPEKYDACLRIQDVVWSNHECRLLLEGAMIEVSIVWRDEETGLLVKARPDILNLEIPAIGDLKSCLDAREYAFSWTVADRRYQRQMGLYSEGASIITGIDITKAILIPVEKKGYNGIKTYPVDPHALDLGRQEAHAMLRRYARCQREQQWAGYKTGFETIYLPAKAEAEIMERIARYES